jgi:hypothetical protein
MDKEDEIEDDAKKDVESSEELSEHHTFAENVRIKAHDASAFVKNKSGLYAKAFAKYGKNFYNYFYQGECA